MKHKHKVVSVLLLGTLLLSACGNNAATTNQTAGAAGATNSTVQTQTQTDSNSATTEQGDQQTGTQPSQMNESDMKMMGLLGSLSRMNEQADLEITSEQATQLLPIVKEIVDANALTDANQSAILAILSEDQKTYIENNQNQMPSGNGAGGDGQPPQGTPPEGAAPNGGTQGEQTTPPQGEQPSDAGNTGDRPTPPNGGQGGGGMGMNPGQQLLEWLESKTS